MRLKKPQHHLPIICLDLILSSPSSSLTQTTFVSSFHMNISKPSQPGFPALISKISNMSNIFISATLCSTFCLLEPLSLNQQCGCFPHRLLHLLADTLLSHLLHPFQSTSRCFFTFFSHYVASNCRPKVLPFTFSHLDLHPYSVFYKYNTFICYNF